MNLYQEIQQMGTVEREQALVEELRRFKPDSEVLRFYEDVGNETQV